MKQLTFWYFKLLEIIMVLCLAAMCLMVFGNVVLRHFFDSGLNVSEELSRFMFIWLTFLGATVAMREGGHLQVDILLRRLSGKPLFVVRLTAELVVLLCCSVFLWGLLRQHSLNVANTGMVTGIPLVIVYSAAYLCAASIAVMTTFNIVRLLVGRGASHVASSTLPGE